MIEFYRRARKAVRGAAVAVLPWAYVVVESVPRRITAGEWLGLVGLVLGVGGTVYATRNYAPIRGGGIMDGDRGAVDIVGFLVLVILLLILCRIFGLL